MCVEIWESIKSFSNSNFFTAFVGAGAGAWAGAHMAGRIMKRNKDKDDITKEIKNTNVAITLSYNICSTLISLKHQHITPLKDNYASYVDSISKIKAGEKQNNALCMNVDLIEFSAPNLPINTLQNFILEKLSINGLSLMLVFPLIDRIASLKNIIEKRNHLLEKLKPLFISDNKKASNLYFGTPDENGHTDTTYSSLINAAHTLANDAIFLSYKICVDLQSYGLEETQRFNKNFGESGQEVNNVNFSEEISNGLIPSEESYADLLKHFIAN